MIIRERWLVTIAGVSTEPRPFALRRLLAVLLPTFVLVLPTFLLPSVPLDGELATLAVHVSDSGYWTGLPFICALVIALIVSRPGLTTRRRATEAGFMVIAMLVALAGNALLNENVIKPRFAVPRPDIVALTEAGSLEPEVDQPDEFYALGDKDARRVFLRSKLETLDEPKLAPLVREHWITETGYSFPSGHSTAAMTFASMIVALSLMWLSGWRLSVLSVAAPLWALAVVYARPLLTVHSPVDVTVGTVIGFCWGIAASAFVRWAADRFGADKIPINPA
jgi:phosphatidylglycerophosphatase B